MIKIATHDGKFHTDDVFAVATLSLVLGEGDYEVVRTRDEKLIEASDYAADVGFVYDPDKNRFDHHQEGGAGRRDNGIEYSSFGLIWKKFGEEICGSEDIATKVDQILVQTVDAVDNGMNISKPVIEEVYPFDVNSLVNLYRPTWKEELDWDKRFFQAVEWAKSVLRRIIEIAKVAKEAEDVISAGYEAAADKRIIVLEREYDAGRELVMDVLSKLPEPVYAVFYRSEEENWQVLAIRKSGGTFESRKPLPESWRAKRAEEFSLAAGIQDGVFCHRTGFMCLAGSKESALALAEKALEA